MLAISLGLFMGIAVMFFGSRITKDWFQQTSVLSLYQWQEIILRAPSFFFIILIIFYVLGSLIGGIITAVFVKTAKEAYASLIGIILSIFLFLYIFFYKMPLWFEIIAFFIFFPTAWLRGKLIAYFYQKYIYITYSQKRE